MIKTTRSFLVKIIIFTVIIFGITAALFSTLFKNYTLGSYPYLILLIATVTTIGHLLIIRASEKNAMKFTTAFMASVTFKLMAYLFFMLIYLVIDHSQVISFVLTFMSLYVAFTIFEVIQVLNFIKKYSKISL
ncbi:MAG: hypothetical protein WCL21_10470 [Mariniphaga sp.]